MANTFTDMLDNERLMEYKLPGGAYAMAIDPLVDDLFDAVFLRDFSCLDGDCLRLSLEQTARTVIKLARNAVKDGFPVDALDYRVESALPHFPFSEQERIRKEFRLPAPHISKECEIALY